MNTISCTILITMMFKVLGFPTRISHAFCNARFWFCFVLQARLAFCKFMVKPSTLLVLDEPTNHLDIPSKEMLEVLLRSCLYDSH